MYNYTTSIQLHSLEEIYDFRTKVYDITELLATEKTQPSRVSSHVSSCLRQLFKAHPNGVVFDVKVEIEPHHSTLSFVFPQPVEAGNNRLVKTFATSAIRRQEIFDAVVETLSQKTKEALQQELSQSSEDLRRTTYEKARMEEELNVAKDIQLSMLPLSFPAFPHRSDLDIFAHLIPAKEVGGDFYDFFLLDEQHLCFTVGDVSGKGVPAALMMAVCKTLLKSRASSDKSTASILSHVNNEMAKDNKNFMFVTVFLAILHLPTGELTYSNAGHNPTYIRRTNGELLKLTELHGPVIAAMEGMSYTESKVRLRPNDLVFAYTDGITEAHNASGAMFGDQRLSQWLGSVAFGNAEQMVHDIVTMTQQFETGTTQFDDITALCVHYIGNPVSNKHTEHIVIRNDMEAVQTVIGALETFGEQHQIDMATIMKTCVVVDELLSNIIKYGFADQQEHLIEVLIQLQDRTLVLAAYDDGAPFNPFQKTPPDITKSIEERELGGLGVHLVRQLMDDFDYRREGDRNVVSVSKHNV